MAESRESSPQQLSGNLEEQASVTRESSPQQLSGNLEEQASVTRESSPQQLSGNLEEQASVTRESSPQQLSGNLEEKDITIPESSTDTDQVMELHSVTENQLLPKPTHRFEQPLHYIAVDLPSEPGVLLSGEILSKESRRS